MTATGYWIPVSSSGSSAVELFVGGWIADAEALDERLRWQTMLPIECN